MESSSFRPVIKWTGSKRSLSKEIVDKFPRFDTYFEPFVGGGSILYQANPAEAVCGDICQPLIEIWKLIRDDPQKILDYYRSQWERLQDEGPEVYYEVRDRFNQSKDPKHLFFLSRTCVNGLIRFNQKGEFNNSFHLSRPGIHPDRIGPIMRDWSRRISNSKFIASDYSEIVARATEEDFIYLDPPYFNTKDRYYGAIDTDRLLEVLDRLNERGVRYALSLDGFSGETDYRVEIPSELFTEQYLLTSGNSSFKKVIDGETAEVKESLYLNYESPETGSAQSQLESF